MHDMNAFMDTRARKIISPYLRICRAQCPMCAVKNMIWIFRLPMTRDETYIQRMCDGMMQMRMHETERKQHKGVIHTYETAEIQL